MGYSKESAVPEGHAETTARWAFALSTARRAMGLTKTQVAGRIGVSEAVVRAMDEGTHYTLMRNLMNYATLVGVDLADCPHPEDTQATPTPTPTGLFTVRSFKGCEDGTIVAIGDAEVALRPERVVDFLPGTLHVLNSVGGS